MELVAEDDRDTEQAQERPNIGAQGPGDELERTTNALARQSFQAEEALLQEQPEP